MRLAPPSAHRCALRPRLAAPLTRTFFSSPADPDGPKPGEGPWWHATADPPQPSRYDDGTASAHSVFVGATSSLLLTEMSRGMLLTFAHFWKEKARVH